MRNEAQDGSMSDGGPPVSPEPVEKIMAAFTSVGRAVTEFAESLRPVVETLVKFAQDPRLQAAIAGDRVPFLPDCCCLCAAVHRGDPGICEGESVSTVRVSGLEVPMCAPCQAARAASKLSRQA